MWPRNVETLRTPEQMDAACKQFAHRIPLLANMVEGGKTPVQSAAELGACGFKIVIFPAGTVRAVTHTLQGYYASLHQHQTTVPCQQLMLDFDGLNAVLGTCLKQDKDMNDKTACYKVTITHLN